MCTRAHYIVECVRAYNIYSSVCCNCGMVPGVIFVCSGCNCSNYYFYYFYYYLLFIKHWEEKKRQPFHSLFEWLYFVPHLLLLLLLRAVLVFLCTVFIAPDITLLDARIWLFITSPLVRIVGLYKEGLCVLLFSSFHPFFVQQQKKFLIDSKVKKRYKSI